MDDVKITGATAAVQTLINCGIEVCFANPGTSEMHFVAALDTTRGLRCVLGLQENAVTGMADGYYRIKGRPAATLLHCGPGLANGHANLHNARRAESGIVNIVGDHAVAHVPYDSPLTSDIAALSSASSDDWRMASSTADLGAEIARVTSLAGNGIGHGKVASLVLPADISWNTGAAPATPLRTPELTPPDPAAIASAASALQSGKKVVFVLGSAGLTGEAQPLIAAIAARSGAALRASGMVAVQPCGHDALVPAAVPYPVDLALADLAAFEVVITVGCPLPTAFFLYPGRPSLVTPAGADHIVLAERDNDTLACLAALAAADGASAAPLPLRDIGSWSETAGPIEPEGFAEVVCSLIPKGAIVVNEALTLGTGFRSRMARTASCDWLHITGGAIGGGIPVATGAAIASGGKRPVITLQADGSAAYTLQALWTQARENLPCITLILNNRSYAILLGEYAKVGANPGQTAMDMLSLERPQLDWPALAQGFGVRGESVESLEDLQSALQAALKREGPSLIDVRFA